MSKQKKASRGKTAAALMELCNELQNTEPKKASKDIFEECTRCSFLTAAIYCDVAVDIIEECKGTKCRELMAITGYEAEDIKKILRKLKRELRSWPKLAARKAKISEADRKTKRYAEAIIHILDSIVKSGEWNDKDVKNLIFHTEKLSGESTIKKELNKPAVVVDVKDRRILEALNKYNQLQFQVDLESDKSVDLSRKFIGKRLKRLKDSGYICYPKGIKGGISITELGQEVIKTK